MFRELCRILGFYLFGFSGILVIPTLLATYYEAYVDPSLHLQTHSTHAFLMTLGITLLLAGILYGWGRSANRHVYKREGIAAVVLIWILTPALCALPFYLSGILENYHQAYFEAVSGLTTTGATVLEAKQYDTEGHEIPIEVTVPGVINTLYKYKGTVTPIRDQDGHILFEGVEAVGKALLFWRSFIQWMGGVGIVVLFVAILPLLGAGGKLLYQAEVPGPVKEGLTPRITETAGQLWKIYCILSFTEIVLLMLTNAELPFFDAITITFSTLSTGGFSIKNASIGSYQNLSTEWIVMIFMVAGGINFSLYYYALKGKIFRLNDSEFLLYLASVILGSLFISWLLWNPLAFSDAFRHGTFQWISALTSTGFVTSYYNVWPYTAQILLLFAMYIGGMSGSTAGGIKTVRHYMLFKALQSKVESIFRPHLVRHLTIGGKELDFSGITTVLCFFVIVIVISTLGAYFYVLDGIDPETSMGLTACMVNNTGLAFRVADASHSCAFLSDFSLLLSNALMILGRLEFFAVLALLVPSFWKQQ